MPNIARIFGRVISSLFALCNLFTISKNLRIYATYGVFPWEWSAFSTQTRENYPRFVLIFKDSSVRLFSFD